MTDLLTQLRDYGEQLEAQMAVLEPEDVRLVRVGTGPVRPVVDREPPRLGGRLIAIAAGLAAVVAVVLALLFWPRSGDPAPFVEDGSTIPGTTITVTTTLTPSTTASAVAPTITAATGEPGVVVDRCLASSATGAVKPLWAASAQEVWMGNPFCRLRDGACTCFPRSPGYPPLDLAATADGTLWVATSDGVFSFDGAEWIQRFEGPTGAVAVDAAGTVWIGGYTAGDPGGYARWLARWDGQGWVRVDSHPERAPVSSEYVRLAVRSRGEAWIGGFVYTGCASGESGVTRYDGTTMREVPLPGPECTFVHDLAVAPNGDLWAILSDSRVARFDGAEWIVFPPAFVQFPWSGVSRGGDLAVGPDGVVWVVCQTGLCSYDGTRWTVRVAEREIAGVDVAPDGTVWYIDPQHGLQPITP